MKRLISVLIFFSVIFVVLCCNAFSFQEHWVRKTSPTTRWLLRCFFADTAYGWAAGDSGTVIHTTDGGETWVIQNLQNTEYPVEDIFFVNRNTGWVVCINPFTLFHSRILRTTNSGLNWVGSYYPDSSVYLTNIYFLDSFTGYIGGLGGVILKTTDSGISWVKLPAAVGGCSTFPVNSITFSSSSFGLTAGGFYDLSGAIWKTADAGANWTASCLSTTPFYDIFFVDPLTVIAAGGDYQVGGVLAKSSDGGVNWSYIHLNIFGICQRIARRTSGEFWIPMGFSSKWAFSSDTARTWTQVNTPDNAAFYDAVFKTPTFGIAVGSGGAIYKYDITIGMYGNEKLVPTESRLLQNYPNPFNSSTLIEYVLVKDSKVKITVYDLLGKELRVLVNEPKSRGYHKITFNPEDLPSGVYVYRMEADGYTSSQKMVLLK